MIFLVWVFLTLVAVVFLYDEVDKFLEKKVKNPLLRRGLKWFSMCFAIVIFFLIFFYICLRQK